VVRVQKALKTRRPRVPTDRASSMPVASQTRDASVPRGAQAGNQQLLRSLGVRAKLDVGGIHDPEEHEADRAASAFVAGERAPAIRAQSDAALRRACAGCEDDVVRRAPDGGARGAGMRGGAVGDTISRAMRASQGSTLPESLRTEFAAFFGDNLANVRVHVGSEAARANRLLSSRAFTGGRDIFFGSGHYQPETTDGRRLLAHELTHVMQGADTLRRDWPDDAGVEECFESPRLVPQMPWVYHGSGNASVDSTDLYGVDLSSMPEFDPVAANPLGVIPGGPAHAIAFPDLLVGDYQREFHAAMERMLDADCARMESILLQSSIPSGEVFTLLDTIAFWSGRADIRTAEGHRTYFDELLHRLQRDQLREAGMFTTSAPRSFLDELFTVAGDRVAELTTPISQHSVEFGGYRPLWAVLARGDGFLVSDSVNTEFAARTAEEVLSRLRGVTTSEASRIIADVLIGLTPQMQHEVLRQIMERFDETDFTGVFGRHGEPTREAMLYWLYEDLTAEDRERLSESLVSGGTLPRGATEALSAGRGAGQWFPVTTHLGSEATTFWADAAVENEGNAWGYGASVMGGFSSLWLPETATSTATTLVTAGAAPGIAEAFPTVGRGLLVLGTGATAYGTTIALQELIGGRDVYSGRRLDDGEMIARTLEVISGILSLGAGFLQAAAMAPRSTGLSVRPRLPGLLSGSGETPSSGRFGMRLLSRVGDEVVVLCQDGVSGEFVRVELNIRTGAGRATHLGTGEALPISGFRLGEAPLGLLGTGGATDIAPGVSIVPTSSVPADAIPATTTPAAPPASPRLPLGTIPAATLALPPGPPVSSSGVTLSLPPGDVPLALPPPSVSPAELDFGAALQADMVAEFGEDADTPALWIASEDGTVFISPPRGMAIYSPDGVVPPAEWFRGTPPVEILSGPLGTGFTPFDVLSPPAPTSRTLSSVRGTRGGNVIRGAAGRDRMAELHGGPTEQTIELPGGLARRADLLSPALPGRLNMEVKTYLRFTRTAGGPTLVHEVSPSAFLRSEIMRDAMIMYYYPGYQSVWVFVDAPPLAALIAELTEAGIPYILSSDRLPFTP